MIPFLRNGQKWNKTLYPIIFPLWIIPSLDQPKRNLDPLMKLIQAYRNPTKSKTTWERTHIFPKQSQNIWSHPYIHRGDSGACFDGLLRRFPGLHCSLAVQTPVRWEPCGCAGGCDFFVQPVHVNHIYSTCATYLHDQTCKTVLITLLYHPKKKVKTNSRAFCLLAPRFSSRIHMLNKA